VLYHVRMDVHPPQGGDPAEFERLKTEEKAFSQELQRQGKWVHRKRCSAALLPG
jgi:muconolactone D-isomerase